MSAPVDPQAINAAQAGAGAKDPQSGTTGHAQTGERYEVGPADSHNRLDSKDERSIANTLADAGKTEQKEKIADQKKAELAHDPTLAARMHGNEPSSGAKKDLSIIEDEEEELRKKDEAKKQSKEAHKH